MINKKYPFNFQSQKEDEKDQKEVIKNTFFKKLWYDYFKCIDCH